MEIKDDSGQQEQPETTPNSDVQNEAMLTPLEARILGALMEKQLTTPDAYPLTLNSLVLACNQKTSREPIMSLEEGEVQHCLYQLQDRKLVEFEYGARANKFKQRLVRELLSSEAEHAVFSIMMLRGPQTVNELFSRTRRMHEFKTALEVEELLSGLLNKITPRIKKMPQQVGQREARYMHLLCGEPEVLPVQIAEPSTRTQASTDALTARIEELEKQVAWLIENIKKTDG